MMDSDADIDRPALRLCAAARPLDKTKLTHLPLTIAYPFMPYTSLTFYNCTLTRPVSATTYAATELVPPDLDLLAKGVRAYLAKPVALGEMFYRYDDVRHGEIELQS